jgi:hypothetical protein
LTASDPSRLAWAIADEVAADPTPRALAGELPDEATVLTIGWPVVAGAALLRRGDARVLCADSRHQGSAFLRQLERADIDCEPVPAESLARAVATADIVLLEAVAACPRRVLAPLGSHVVAAVAADLGVPVWCAFGIGRRLPPEYVDAIADRVVAGAVGFDIDVDELPVRLITRAVTTDVASDDVAGALRPECAYAPELLRASPI